VADAAQRHLRALVAVVPLQELPLAVLLVGVLLQSPGAQELIGFCRERIAGYKCPKSVDFVDELPKSTVGKILRREVKDRYWPDAG